MVLYSRPVSNTVHALSARMYGPFDFQRLSLLVDERGVKGAGGGGSPDGTIAQFLRLRTGCLSRILPREKKRPGRKYLEPFS